MGRPTSVTTDDQERIYVADLATMNINVYDRDGNYLREIGSRGRGPGEFQRITSMYMKGEFLLVYDKYNSRITQFTLDGSISKMIALDSPRGNAKIRSLEEGYLFLFKEGTYRDHGAAKDQSQPLFHIYGNDFQQVIQEFAPANRVVDVNSPVVGVHMGNNPGHLTLSPTEDTLLYAPSLYDGTLYRYVKKETTGYKMAV